MGHLVRQGRRHGDHPLLGEGHSLEFHWQLLGVLETLQFTTGRVVLEEVNAKGAETLLHILQLGGVIGLISKRSCEIL